MQAGEATLDVWRQHVGRVSDLLAECFENRDQIDILEAGCGSGSYLRFPSNARITGIDISAEQLQRNTRIHERILGDLQTYAFAPSTFDAIVCWDVLEHLAAPASALDRFATALRTGG